MPSDRERNEELQRSQQAPPRESDLERLDRLRADMLALSRDFEAAPEQVGNYFAEMAAREAVSGADVAALHADLGSFDAEFADRAFSIGGGGGDEAQRKAAPGAEVDGEAPRRPGGAGQKLADEVRRRLEAALGADLASVRVHEDGSAEALGAEAYTVGEDVHFAPGRFDPGSERGQALLGHELAHVVQQREGRVSAEGEIGGVAVNADAGLEAEADRVGAQVAAGARSVMRSAAGAVAGGGAAQLKGGNKPINLFPSQADLMQLSLEREKPIRDWLDAHRATIGPLTRPAGLVSQIKGAVKAVASWQDIEITTAVIYWCNTTGVEVPGIRAHHQQLLDARTGAKKPARDSTLPLVTAIKNDPVVKALTTFFGDGYKVYSGAPGTVTISKGGLDVDMQGVKYKPTANVGPSGVSVGVTGKSGTTASLSVTWDGTVTFKVGGKGFSVSTTVGKDAVTLGAKYKVGITGTQGTDLKSVFTDGEASFRKIASAIGTVGSFEEAIALKDTLKDDIARATKVFDAVSTIKGLAEGPKLSIDIGVEGRFPTSPDPSSDDPANRGPSVSGGVWLVLTF